MKARVAAPEPAPRPSAGGVWIAVLVVVGTSAGMLALAFDHGSTAPVLLGTAGGGPLVERAGARRDGDPVEPPVAVPPAPEIAPTAPGPAPSLADASRRVPIELYTATWCAACASAHRWLDANDVHYEEIDVDRRPGARDQLTALNPRRTLPTFDVDGDVLVGFDPGRLSTAINTAAARHAN